MQDLGTPVCCVQESEMIPLIAVTGHISHFYLLLNTSEQFLLNSGSFLLFVMHVCMDVWMYGYILFALKQDALKLFYVCAHAHVQAYRWKLLDHSLLPSIQVSLQVLCKL